MDWGNVPELMEEGDVGNRVENCPEKAAQKSLQGDMLDEETWSEFPPSPREVANYLENQDCGRYEEEAELFADYLEDAEIQNKDLISAVAFRIGTFLSGNFVNNETTADIYGIEYTPNSPGSSQFERKTREIKEVIGLEQPLRKPYVD